MSYTGQYGDSFESREPGARRKKLAGYLRAANELRQTYASSYKQAWNTKRELDDDAGAVPGAFPGSSMTSFGDEQLVIFPSYGRRHTKRKRVDAYEEPDENDEPGDQDFWQREWDKHEDESALVDIDVRGWIYAPHRGPPTRKHRLLVGLARQLSGIPAPRNSPSTSKDSSRAPSPMRFSDRLESHNARQEEEMARKEADSIVRRGEAEARVARNGGYSESPSEKPFTPPFTTSPSQSRESSPGPTQSDFPRSRQGSRNDSPVPSSPRRQSTWNTVADMSQAELLTANNHLISRLQPFLANPLCNTPISAFFYNDTVSRQKSVETDASGHFSLRAALDFVPTHVRVLASDRLSATQEIAITERKGVSVISDIDDTIKHSGIGSGAKEIFKNVFVREVGELAIKGVKEWYSALAEMGCTFHYVSNSPWQLYPVLTSFFSAAGLPPGSFHLKQYTGMLQGIFEPVAERKKGTLERILLDFPERRFLLIGDSGEADLEVYTDIVLEYPGRILGVFIRDVTTSTKQKFFDIAQGSTRAKKPQGSRPDGIAPSKTFPQAAQSHPDYDAHEADLKEAIKRSLEDGERESTGIEKGRQRPALPPRRPTAPAAPEEDLIDLDFDDHSSEGLPDNWLRPPPRPAKPRSLSAQPLEKEAHVEKEASALKTPPPRPRKPSTSVHTAEPKNSIGQTGDNKQSGKTERPDVPPQRLARRPVNREGQRNGGSSLQHTEAPQRPVEVASRKHYEDAPPLPPRKPQLAGGSSDRSPRAAGAQGEDSPTSWTSGWSSLGTEQDMSMSKKEEAWLRRWARAKDTLERKGVMLRCWRVGEDVERHATALVEEALKQERGGNRRYERPSQRPAI